MYYVEDALEWMAHSSSLFITDMPDAWAANFTVNVYGYVSLGKPLSSEQARIILKLLARCRNYMVSKGVSASQIDDLINNPRYRKAPYPSSNVPREVRYLGDNLLGFRFKMNEVIVNEIKALHRNSVFDHLKPWFHSEYRIWVVPVTRQTMEKVIEIISKHRFDFDDAVAEYLTLSSNSKGQQSSFVSDSELGIIAGQVCDNELIAWWVTNVVGGEAV